MPGTDAARLDLTPGMKGFDERFKKERALRLQNGQNVLSFGVPFLDDALGGIYANDLIVLGSRTGGGKTQQVMLTALANARAGKRVHFFALEAEEYEIERRMRYQILAQRFYADPNRPRVYLNYLDWYYGNLDSALSRYENEIDQAGSMFPSLKIYYRSGEFTGHEFERIFLGIKDETDLVIVDHLHYFDIDDDNENRAVKAIVKKIRDCCLIAGKPVILVSHIRKSDRRMKLIVPDIEDFHGSSDIGKIATKAVTLAPNYEMSTKEIRQTYFSVSKCRVDGARTSSVGVLAYNLNTQSYQRDYFLGRISSDLTEFIPTSSEDLPQWAKGARNGKGPAQEVGL